MRFNRGSKPSDRFRLADRARLLTEFAMDSKPWRAIAFAMAGLRKVLTRYRMESAPATI
ncbi:hypothetical protein GCM10023319_25640 [Nocardia iowensis]